MSPRPALMTNVAQRRQAEFSKRFVKDRDRENRAALLEVMGTAAGRMVLWSLLERAGVFRSVMAADGEIQYLAGRQDFGHEVMNWAIDVDQALYLTMEQEARARLRSQDREVEASRLTPPAEDEGDEP